MKCKDKEWIILDNYGVRGRAEANTELDKMANYLYAILLTYLLHGAESFLRS